MKDCPSGAITVKKKGEKEFEMEIDLGKCIFCAQCVDTCPKKALEISPEYELARLERGKLKVLLDEGPTEPSSEQPEEKDCEGQ